MTRIESSDAGTVLIEALVAFAVAAGVMILSLGAFAQATARLKAAEDRVVALAEARALLAELAAREPLAASSRSGTTPEGLAWTVQIEEFANIQAPFSLKPFHVLLQLVQRGGEPLIEIETYVISRSAEK